MGTQFQLRFARSGSFALSVDLRAIESSVTRGLATRYGDVTARAELTLAKSPLASTSLRLAVFTARDVAPSERGEFAAAVNGAVNGAGQGTYVYNRFVSPITFAAVNVTGTRGRQPAASPRPLATVRAVASRAVVVSTSPARSGLSPVAADKVETPEAPVDPLAPASWVPVVATVLVVATAAGGLYWLYKAVT